MAEFLSQDGYGRTVCLPVIKLAGDDTTGSYLIGLQRYELRYESYKGEMALVSVCSGISLSEILKCFHERQML